MTLSTTKWIESLFNRLLKDNQEYQDALLKYKGKVTVIEIVNTSASYVIRITDDGINLDNEIPSSVDVTIRATPLAIINYLGAVKRSESLVSGSMEVTGDIALAQGILSIIRDLQIDWEEYLSYWTGDIMAHKVGNLLSNSRELLLYANNSIREDISEYLKFESKHLLSEPEILDFNNSVENLRDDVERLKVRVNRIKDTSEGKES